LFFDEATITVRSGDGGNGCVSFRREKYVPLGGPNGGNGGRGGNVYLRASSKLNTLVAFRRRRHFRAKDGVHGMGKGMQGRSGDDLYIEVPTGTVVHAEDGHTVLKDLTQDGQLLLVAAGRTRWPRQRGIQVFRQTHPPFCRDGAAWRRVYPHAGTETHR